MEPYLCLVLVLVLVFRSCLLKLVFFVNRISIKQLALKVESSHKEFLHEAFHLHCLWIEFWPCLFNLFFL